MKFYKYIFLCILAGITFVTACQQKEDVIPYGDFTDIAIFSPATGEAVVQVEGLMSFADGSRGTTSRLWTIPNPSYFINNDTSELTEEIAHIRFMEVGSVPVNLHLEFTDTTANYDSTIMVTVLDSITTDLDVVSIAGNYTEEENKLVIEAGSIVTMTDTSSGNPDTYEWILEGFEDQSYSTKTVEILYKKLGLYDVQLISSRVKPYGRPDTLLLEDFIEVIPSTLPIVVTSVDENESGVIEVQFSRDLDNIGLDEIENFTVMVNGTTPAVITNLALNSADQSILEITVEENILNSQTATVSYNADNGNIRSSDFVDVETVTDLPINIYAVEIFNSNNDFESGVLAPFGDPFVENAGAGGTGSYEMLTGSAVSGNHSLGITMGESTRMSFAMITDFFSVEKDKTYAFEFWVKVDENPSKIEMTVRFMPGDGWNDSYKQWLGSCCTTALKVENIGTWQKVTMLTDKNPPADWAETKIHFQLFSGAGGQTKIEFDNLRFYEYEVGPTE
ncbi:carbohydrate binding domain-containing protein [Flammeovirga pacifica]|uniref:CBM-cenC domain-containing protein n=1 Tax=Flammeovirga pacifica TaxID=915059 RepID=A0A1S1Z044_FLAPC|nr:carbohydrate binding domain-containing protein [Flammeovirga pacifica]OHX66622.1 hypothetical protein NH26_09760 [Flammeovirga pacifica]